MLVGFKLADVKNWPRKWLLTLGAGLFVLVIVALPATDKIEVTKVIRTGVIPIREYVHIS